MHTKDLTYSDHGGGHQRVPVIEGTNVAAVAASRDELVDAHAEFVTISRERNAAQGDP
ncbi:MAG: hypothetical protein GX871_06240, partial [Microbacteriaceae bacterium]|nr:hypothetical protein [Microbacteriaceae bacterium]